MSVINLTSLADTEAFANRVAKRLRKGDVVTLAGDLGADTINSGSGMDWVDYSGSNAGVTVDLTTGAGAGGAGGRDRG